MVFISVWYPWHQLSSVCDIHVTGNHLCDIQVTGYHLCVLSVSLVIISVWCPCHWLSSLWYPCHWLSSLWYPCKWFSSLCDIHGTSYHICVISLSLVIISLWYPCHWLSYLHGIQVTGYQLCVLVPKARVFSVRNRAPTATMSNTAATAAITTRNWWDVITHVMFSTLILSPKIHFYIVN